MVDDIIMTVPSKVIERFAQYVGRLYYPNVLDPAPGVVGKAVPSNVGGDPLIITLDKAEQA